MGYDKRLKLFISYSHEDEGDKDKFKKHIKPLERLIDVWDDRKILAGQDFQNEIDYKFKNMDIFCLLISANFISSVACMNELKEAAILKKKKGATVVPIILSPCAWQDIDKIKGVLALPTDGKPISCYKDSDYAWHIVYTELKRVVEKELITRKLKITDSFKSFLTNMEMLTKAHSKKEQVLLDDIFIYPELEEYNELDMGSGKISSNKLLDIVLDQSKILIAGENQSGKTTLCKKLFLELRSICFIPIYIADGKNQYRGVIENKIKKAFNEQYVGASYEEIDRERIIPILDNFHQAKHKRKLIISLVQYDKQIVIVDDIFCLNIRDESLVEIFSRYKIKEFIPSLRNKLIGKWISLTDKSNNGNQNLKYREIDETTERVNTSLGKVFGSGIMPSYPFFILAVMTTFDAFAKPLDQEITSHGYCYQAMIYLYLRKNKVKNEDIDSYVNFLTELAFYFFKEQKETISPDRLDGFIADYKRDFNLSIKEDILLEKLRLATIFGQNNFGNYLFPQLYIYYYFAGKYLAENLDTNKRRIDAIIKNLHKDENAYIATFISHHSKSSYILDEVVLNAMLLFEEYSPATLTKNELSFFDDSLDNFVRIEFPKPKSSPEKERAKRLKQQDDVEEQLHETKEDGREPSDDNSSFDLDIRRGIKTVEVMGQILKNREGSLKIPRIEEIFREAINVYLRFLMSFFELIKKPENQKEIIGYLSDNFKKHIATKQEKGLQEKKFLQLATEFFWAANFGVVYTVIWKIIRTTGSNKLTSIINNACNDLKTPASFLINHGILMWYNKNLQVANIAQAVKDNEFSDTAERVLKILVYDHSLIHFLNYDERQKIENILKIPQNKLLTMKAKAKEKIN